MDCNTPTNVEPAIVIIDKNGLVFSRMKKNNYTTSFSMINNCILLPQIVNFDIMNLL